MITETVFNLYPIIKYGIIVLAIFGGCFLINNLINVVKDVIFKNKDTKITTNLIDKFPLVSPDFIKKPQKEQLLENNQEIHEINKRFDDLDDKYNEILEILKKLTEITEEELKKNG